MRKLELSHDVIAKKVWELLPPDEVERRKVLESIQQRSQEYQEGRASLAGRNELGLWQAYLSVLPLSREERAYVEASQKAYKDKQPPLKKWYFLSILGLIIATGLAVGFIIANIRLRTEKGENQNQQARIDYQRKIDKALAKALALKDEDRNLSYRLLSAIIQDATAWSENKNEPINLGTAIDSKEKLLNESSYAPFYRAKARVSNQQVQKIIALPADTGSFYILSYSDSTHHLSLFSGRSIIPVDSFRYDATIRDIGLAPGQDAAFRVLCSNGQLHYWRAEKAGKAIKKSRTDTLDEGYCQLSVLDYAGLFPENIKLASIYRADVWPEGQQTAFREVGNLKELALFRQDTRAYYYSNQPEYLSSFLFVPGSRGHLLASRGSEVSLYSASESALAEGSKDSTRLELLPIFTTYSRYNINQMAFSQDGQYLLVGSHDGQVELFNWLKRQRRLKKVNSFFGGQQSITALAFAPGGKNFLTGGADGSIKIWDIEGVSGTINPIKIEEEYAGHRIALAAGNGFFAYSTGSAKPWEIPPCILIRKLNSAAKAEPLKGHAIFNDNIIDIETFPDGKTILSVTQNGLGQIFDAHTGLIWPDQQTNAYTLPNTIGSAYCVAVSDNYFVFGGRGNSNKGHNIALYSYRPPGAGAIQLEQSWPTPSRVQSIAINPDGSVIAGLKNGQICVFDKNGKKIQQLPGHKESVETLCLSPNRQFLASGGLDCKVMVWEKEDSPDGPKYKPFSSIPTYAAINVVKFSANGALLMTGGASDMLRVFKLDEQSRQPLEIRKITAHEGDILDGTFFINPNDGKEWIMTSSTDGAIKFWDFQNFEKNIQANIAPLADEVNAFMAEMELRPAPER